MKLPAMKATGPKRRNSRSALRGESKSKRAPKPTGPQHIPATRAYLRVSTDVQEYGLAAQLSALLEYAEGRGLVLGPAAEVERIREQILSRTDGRGKASDGRRGFAARGGNKRSEESNSEPLVTDKAHIYVDDATSGAVELAKRPAGALLLADLQPGDTLLVFCLSRLGRRFSDTMRQLEELSEKKVKVVAVNMGMEFDFANPLNECLAAMLCALNQLKRRMDGMATAAAKRECRRRGIWTGGTIPVGEKVVEHRGKKLLRNCEWELWQIGHFFRWYRDEGWSVQQIHRHAFIHRDKMYRSTGRTWSYAAVKAGIQKYNDLLLKGESLPNPDEPCPVNPPRRVRDKHDTR